MTYYTNSNHIKELMTSLTKFGGKGSGCSWIDVGCDGAHFRQFVFSSFAWHYSTVRSPDGTSSWLERYNSGVDEEEWESLPTLGWVVSCVVSWRSWRFQIYPLQWSCHVRWMHLLDATQTITSSSMFNAIKDLLEPIRFGEGVAIRLKDQSNDCEVKSLLTFDRAD